MASRIYLDNSAAAKPSETVLSTWRNHLGDFWAAPHMPHAMGQEMLMPLRDALKKVYRLAGAEESDDLVITSSGAEAVNHVFASAHQDITRRIGRNHFVIGATDEAPATMAVERLVGFGCLSGCAAADATGSVSAKAVAEVLTPRTVMVSLSWANGLTGVINPIEEIVSLCHEHGVVVHVEATHVLGKMPVDVKRLGADFVSFNASQFHGPAGVGGLFMRPSRTLSPFIVGGIDQGGLRAGALNIPLVLALGEGAREACECIDFVCTETARLRRRFEEGVLERCPEARVLFKEASRVPHVCAIAFPGISNEALLFALNRRGLLASMGGGGFQPLGENLTVCGVEPLTAHCALSFSLARTTTEEEIEQAIEWIAEEVFRLRKASLALYRT